ncbi:MAG TPA: DUF4011 domain-containing protein [Fimbriimonas sp.]|nr:DUF4011 domain-containing protein [Fimbriimonas sp.]
MAQTDPKGDAVRRQIDGLRKKLLDLTLRNRMLNYRPSKRLSIEIVDEDSSYLHRMLVEEGKKMSFVGLPDPVSSLFATKELGAHDDPVALGEFRKAAEEELDAFVENAATPLAQLDSKLNTKELESLLQPKLRTILRESHLASEELGVNTLFLTLGVLSWREEEEKPCLAPLLFVPVRLEQQANGIVKLRHDGGDVGSNLPLEAKLQELNLRLPPWDDEKEVAEYFSEVESTIRSRADWAVDRNAVSLSFFSYEKYAMYVDLSGDMWPEGAKPWDNPDLRAMLGEGYSSPESSIGDSTFIDEVRSVVESREVFDADASQTIALIRAKEGLSIVVEGPPGTGKSQTITNVISEAVAAGKTVLFVSAKRAALDVVKRKLQEADLGPMCLDLHDKLANRREFYAEIKRTVERGLTVRDEEAKVARLTELRDRLNTHSSANNDPLPEYGCSPFEAMSILAGLPIEAAEDREGRVEFEGMRKLTTADIQSALPLVRALQARLGPVGMPTAHPFWGAEIDYLDPGTRLDLQEDLQKALGAVQAAETGWSCALAELGVALASTERNATLLRACVLFASSAPELEGVNLNEPDWPSEADAVRIVTAAIRERNEIRAKLAPMVKEPIWTSDLSSAKEVLTHYGSKWYKVLLGRYRRVRRDLIALLNEALDDDRLLEVIKTVRKAQADDREIEKQDGRMRRLFGAQWKAAATDTEAIERILNWVLQLKSSIKDGQVPADFLDYFSQRHDPAMLKQPVEAACAGQADAVASCNIVAQLLKYPTQGIETTDLSVLRSKLIAWQEGLPKLSDYVMFSEARRKALAGRLNAAVDVADRWSLASERLETSFIRSYYTGVLRDAMQQRPELRTFERKAHEAAIEEFGALDSFKLRYNRAHVRMAHFKRLPTFANSTGNLLQLKLQCELQRRHKPIRWIMKQAGEAIQRIKPVFMMSPLTVAIHIPPEAPLFDLVVFDEASQIRPEDALSAIARAKQCIVVGDTRQMPPSSFFDKLMEDDEPEDEDDLTQEARKLESVLSLMSAVVIGKVRRPDLRWHYRSIHPSLIQPSNEMFYDNRLIVFPSPGTDQTGNRIGMEFHHHPDTVYEGGSKNRVNRMEATLVADRVLNHLKSFPGDSLLVAAMNKPQADLIYDEVAKRERANPELFAAFRERHPNEPLEIKNLETVQGDERDVVLVSITYGRDSGGVIRQQFGPILQDGGERRLNVLFTRARKRCEVFSNMSADDIRAEEGRPGVRALKRYLRFAESGFLSDSAPTGLLEESPFEEEVGDALRDNGYEVHCQVGSEGFRIDLAVVDPSRPGRYVLGIECDGATYHSARSARDRDKLRQMVLENRGWRMHRIWSHDWWQDRDGETERLIQAVGEAITDAPEEPEPEPVLFDTEILTESTNESSTDPSRCYVSTAITPVHDEAGFMSFVQSVVETEGPICLALLLSRIKETGLPGVSKLKLERHIARNPELYRFCADGIYCHAAQLQIVRDWSQRPAKEKKVELITEPELTAAVIATVRNSFGITERELPSAALKLLGFSRAVGTSVERVEAIAEKLLQSGELTKSEQGALRVPHA